MFSFSYALPNCPSNGFLKYIHSHWWKWKCSFPPNKGFSKNRSGHSEGWIEETRTRGGKARYLGAEILEEATDTRFYVLCHSRGGKREAQDQAPTFPDSPKPYLTASFGGGRRNLGHLRHLLSRLGNGLTTSTPPEDFCCKQFLPSSLLVRDFLLSSNSTPSEIWMERRQAWEVAFGKTGSELPPVVLISGDVLGNCFDSVSC